MKENIKIGLLAVIAVTLIYIAAKDNGSNSGNDVHDHSSHDMTTGNVNTANTVPELSLNNPTVNPASVNNGPKTKIEFPESGWDFGKVNQNTKNLHVFEFTNTGSEPLIISNAVGSCGCTVPKFPKEPIAPGEKGSIEVEYSPGMQKGTQKKTVTITANTEPAQTLLTITAEVQEIN